MATPRMDIPCVCMAILHVAIPHMAILSMAIPRVALHETCMFHAMRKHGPHKHVTGILRFLMAPRMDTQKNEVIIEWVLYMNKQGISYKIESQHSTIFTLFSYFFMIPILLF